MFTNWFNHVHDFLPKKKLAEEFHLRKMFGSMRQVAVDRRGDRAHKALLAELGAGYHAHLLKKRGVRRWHRFAQTAMLERTKRILCNRITLSRMFQAWFANVDRLREGKRRHLMWQELYAQQQYRRGLTALRLHCEKKQHEKQIIGVFNERRDMYIKARVYAAMFDNSCETKLKLAGFMHYMRPKATNLIASYFQKWRDTQAALIQEEKADVFHRARACKYLLRVCFDKLKVNKVHDKQVQLRRAWLDQVRKNTMMRQCFIELALYTTKRTKLKHAFKVGTQLRINGVKRRYLRVLIEEAGDLARVQGVEATILRSFKKITLRKVLFALQTYTLLSRRERIVKEKYKLAAFDKFFTRWQGQAYRAGKISAMCRVLEGEQAKKLVRNFMPNLLQAGYYRNIGRLITGNSDRRLKQIALQVLMKKWLLRRMQTSFRTRYLQGLSRTAYNALRQHAT